MLVLLSIQSYPVVNIHHYKYLIIAIGWTHAVRPFKCIRCALTLSTTRKQPFKRTVLHIRENWAAVQDIRRTNNVEWTQKQKSDLQFNVIQPSVHTNSCIIIIRLQNNKRQRQISHVKPGSRNQNKYLDEDKTEQSGSTQFISSFLSILWTSLHFWHHLFYDLTHVLRILQLHSSHECQINNFLSKLCHKLMTAL